MITTHDDKAREREMPTLPKSLLTLIGEYGMARTDGVGELEIQHRWLSLIAGIKDYARAALSPASTGQEAGLLRAAYLAGFNASGEGHNGEYPFGDNNLSPEDDADWIKGRDEALGRLAAPAQQVEAEKWISVTERLPELGVPVLVAVHWVKFREDEDGRPFEQFGVDVTEGQYRYSEHGSYMESFTGPHGDSADHITHWMPLPKPPAAGSINGGNT